MFAPVTQRRAAVEVGLGGVVDNRTLLLEFQLAPWLRAWPLLCLGYAQLV